MPEPIDNKDLLTPQFDRFWNWWMGPFIRGGLWIILGLGLLEGFSFCIGDYNEDKIYTIFKPDDNFGGVFLVCVGFFIILPKALQNIITEISVFFIKPLIPQRVKDKYNNWMEKQIEKECEKIEDE